MLTDWIYQLFYEYIVLEMLIVSQFLVNMVLIGKRTNANIEGTLNECFSCSEAGHFLF
jgi:hypothetical protein